MNVYGLRLSAVECELPDVADLLVVTIAFIKFVLPWLRVDFVTHIL